VSFEPTPDDIADRYADAQARIVALVGDLGRNDLATMVPGTPKWSLHGLLSHLVGGPVDFAAGRLDGAGGEEWTQRQVDARVQCTLAEIIAEWDGIVPAVDTAVRAGQVPVPVAFDILTHESDVRGALGAELTPDPRATRFIVDGFGARAVAVTARVGRGPVELRATDTDWSIGTAGGVVAEATEHEWARALTGRRSNAQVSGFAWSGDPAPYLDLLSPFGPLPTADVIE
jgi:uncharacterized protein (TIGR03083 family)